MRDKIARAALECFVDKGYHGTSMRHISARANVSVPGIYHHFSSKMSLLEELVDHTMDDLIALTSAAFDAAGDDRVDQLRAVIDAHVRFHCERSAESFIGNSELRSLTPASLRLTMAKRDRQQAFFVDTITAGVKAGSFEIDHPHEAAIALASMCTAVATWYHPTGPLTPDDVVAMYQDFALGMVVRTAQVRR